MADEKGNWKRFQRLSFDSRKITKRARRAETNTTRHAHKFVVSKLDSLRNVKQHIIAWLALIAILIAAVAVQMFWYQQAYRTSAWKDGGTYAEAVLGPINTLNPLYASSSAEQSAAKLLFSSLYSYDQTGQLADDLATSRTLSEDGKEYTLTLRNDAKWSDGRKVTAQDVVFTVNLMKSPEVRSVLYNNWVDVSIQEIDDRTVKFVLPARYASFPHALTFAVLPKHVLESVPKGSVRQNTFSVSPISSGPFSLRLLQPSSDGRYKIANLTANEQYYKGSPKLARFQLHAYQDRDDIVQALQSGAVNASVGVSLNENDLPRDYISKQYAVKSGVYALFNADIAAFKDSKVRKALQTGTDTSELRKNLDSNVPELYLPFTNGQLYGSNIPAAPVVDKVQAKKLLDEAGWKLPASDAKVRVNAAKEPLQLRVVTIKDETYERALEELAGQWRELGIDVKTEIRDPASPTRDFVQTTLQPRDYDVLLYELVIGVDPDVYAYWHSSQTSQQGYNFANYKSTISDETLASARDRAEPDLRNEKYKAFAGQWLKDAPAIGLYQSVMDYTYRNSVLPDIKKVGAPSEADRYSSVLYWSAEQRPVYKTP